MANQNAEQLSRHILDDLRESGYYADPETLATLLSSSTGKPCNSQRALDIIRSLLRMYVSGGYSPDQVARQLSDELEAMGVR